MINVELYSQIFRRKSFHTFKERTNEAITNKEIAEIYEMFKSFDSLNSNRVEIKIVKKEETSCSRNAEYCIMMFSEKKDGYLQNIGYLGEQLDLYLVSKNIGTLWFGIAKSNEIYNGLDFVIMIAIAKVSSFRNDMYKSKRKMVEEIWKGNDLGIANIVRFAPSACNSQPWFVENINNELCLYRKTKSGKIGIMPSRSTVFYNQIDMGIFMCFLELCLLKNDIPFERTIQKDDGSLDTYVLNSTYKLQ